MPSHPLRRAGAGALAALALAACGPSSPPPPEVTLPDGGDTVVVRFAEARDAAWLGGNRWAVLLPGGPEVEVVDLAAGTAVPVGGALKNPVSLFRAGDSLYVADVFPPRLTVHGLDGALTRSLSAPAIVRGALPRARDARGNFYVELRPAPGPDGSGNRDSAVVLRLPADLARADTVARLAPLDLAKVQSATGERFERRVFSGVDRWGVRPDGTVWVARVYHNRLDRIAPDGTTRRGDGLPDRVLEVTRADREAFVRKFPAELRASAEQLPFAPTKAAFDVAFTDARGNTWLERSRAVTDTLQGYLVVDPDGRLAGIVDLRGDGHVIGAGDGTVLVAEYSPLGTRLRQVAVPPLVPAAPTKRP